MLAECLVPNLSRMTERKDGPEGCGESSLGIAVCAQQLHEELDASLCVLVQEPLRFLGLLDDGGRVLP